MNAAVRDCLVEDYEPLIETLDLPDADDRHVLAAAIRGGASVIVTFNLKDFPTAKTGVYGVNAQHPDDFVLDLLELNAPKVCHAIAQQRARLKNPPFTAQELLEVFRGQGLQRSAAELAQWHDLL